jgi:hypothetical protein
VIQTQTPEDVALLVLHFAIGFTEAGDLILLACKTLDDLNPLHVLGKPQDQLVRKFAAALVKRTNDL